jgi:type I restriction enzyme S subunit
MKTAFRKSNLKDHAVKIGSGITPRGGQAVYKQEGIPLIRSQNVLNNRLDLSDVAYIDDAQHTKMKSSQVCPFDVLLNITGASIGRSCVVPLNLKDANVNQHVCIIRLKESYDPNFLSSYLNSFYGQKQIQSFQGGGSREGLNYAQIGSFKIPEIPISEQKSIADTISTWDQAIAQTEKLIELKEKKLKILIRKLLKKAHENHTTEYQTLGSILKYEQPTKYIVSCTDYDKNNRIPVLTANKGFILGYTNETSNVFEKNLPAIIFDDFTTDSKFVDFPFKVKSSAMKILYPVSQDYDSLYIFLAMTEIDVLLGGHKRYWLSEYQFYEIPVPNYETQKKLSNIYKLQLEEIKALKELLQNYKSQKQGLMQKLLTGKWRVKVK